ncbi:type II toxin-antitoxin system VapC family toxin [Ruficoccus sp. ZRK36]|uniref:type II toxin-antitoxin system VapC family toxin n=1 Tax=Ruficoccus sp. ZRK36 TaxID=2866311 RepID=UPI001C738347|nr:type II toxin-antitoxin system VapC family toxin [Ruficoccus sp. ZRK36]QYY36446.1 type II toxin-antitoxin system VapC family toxin [Ruficoccus sp. ZRK36]
MIVVDTTVIAPLLLPGANTPWAQQTYERDSAWASSPLWRSELRNVLARYQREHKVDPAACLEIMNAAEEKMHPRQYNILSETVILLAAQSVCSAYECEYVALAQELNVLLVTANERLLEAFPRSTISLEQFARGEEQDHGQGV